MLLPLTWCAISTALLMVVCGLMLWNLKHVHEFVWAFFTPTYSFIHCYYFMLLYFLTAFCLWIQLPKSLLQFKKQIFFEMPWYTQLPFFLWRCFDLAPLLVSWFVATFHCLLHGFMLFVHVYTVSLVWNVLKIPHKNKFIYCECCYSWRKPILTGYLSTEVISWLLIAQASYPLSLSMPT